MNSKIVTTKTTSAIFLGIVLVTGTIVISLSSFSSSSMIREAQAQPYYGVDNNYEKSKDISKSISVNKIKCINTNININGVNSGNISIGNTVQVPTEGYLGTYSSGSDGYYDGYDNQKGKNSNCVINNNNNNTNIIRGAGNQTIPPQTATLTVNKEIFGCTNVREAEMNCSALQNNDPGWIPCTDPAISNAFEFCQAISANLFDIQVLDDQNNQIQQFEGSAQGTTIENLEPGTYTVNEIKHTNSDGELGRDADILQACISAGFPDGGLLITQGTEGEIVYNICFEYEDEQGTDCSTITLAAGGERTCTVKNYLRIAD